MFANLPEILVLPRGDNVRSLSRMSAERSATVKTPSSGDEFDSGSKTRSNATTPYGDLSNSDQMSNVDRQVMLEQKMNGLFKTLEPFVHKLDEHVIAVRTSQELLNQELNHLLQVLHQIKLQESIPGVSADFSAAAARHRTSGDISADLEEKSRRLLGLKRRLTLVHSILQTVNSRTKKLLLAHNSRISTNASLAGSSSLR